jgi:hypothetical protein
MPAGAGPGEFEDRRIEPSATSGIASFAGGEGRDVDADPVNLLM